MNENNDKARIEQDRYDRYALKQEQEWDARCTRCGSCCGAYEDPCENLRLLPTGLYTCHVYDRRFGAWRTRSGESFVCVPIREKIAQGRSCRVTGTADIRFDPGAWGNECPNGR